MDMYDSGIYNANTGGVQLLKKLFEKYGKSVYLRILKETESREIAKKLTVQVFSDLYSRMKEHGSVDSLELLLNEFADTRIKHLRFSELDEASIATLFGKEETTEKTKADEKEETSLALVDPAAEEQSRTQANKAKRKGLSGGAIAGIVIVALIGIWFGIGFLLKADIISGFDLGYEWFNQTIANIF